MVYGQKLLFPLRGTLHLRWQPCAEGETRKKGFSTKGRKINTAGLAASFWLLASSYKLQASCGWSVFHVMYLKMIQTTSSIYLF